MHRAIIEKNLYFGRTHYRRWQFPLHEKYTSVLCLCTLGKKTAVVHQSQNKNKGNTGGGNKK